MTVMSFVTPNDGLYTIAMTESCPFDRSVRARSPHEHRNRGEGIRRSDELGKRKRCRHDLLPGASLLFMWFRAFMRVVRLSTVEPVLIEEISHMRRISSLPLSTELLTRKSSCRLPDRPRFTDSSNLHSIRVPFKERLSRRIL